MKARAINTLSASKLSASLDKQKFNKGIVNSLTLICVGGILISRFIKKLFNAHSNTFKALLSIFFVFFVSDVALATTCSINKDLINVTYEISHSRLNKSDKPIINQLNLIRYKGKVAHHYPNKKMTEIWTQTANQKLKSIHYYDNERRAIEFEPNDLKMIKAPNLPAWSHIYQLINQKLLNQFVLAHSKGTGCYREQTFKLVTYDQHFTMIWLPELDIIKSLSIESENKKNLIELTSILNEKISISNFFEQREQYQSTDFADIGDNETDEFLLKKVSLGFTPFGYH